MNYNRIQLSHLMTKTNKMACAPSEDSDQRGHPLSLIRVFTVRMKKAWVLSTAKTDQTGRMPRLMPSLIWVFAGRSHFVGFVMRVAQILSEITNREHGLVLMRSTGIRFTDKIYQGFWNSMLESGRNNRCHMRGELFYNLRYFSLFFWALNVYDKQMFYAIFVSWQCWQTWQHNPKKITVMLRTDRPGQTVQTQIRLLLEEQSDQGLHCLPFRLHRLDSLVYGKAT